jgi:predicted nucleic acid-binding protein
VRNYFLDTSALVKVYSEEEGSPRVRAIIKGVHSVPALNRVIVSTLAHPEAASALGQIMAGPQAARRGFGSHDRRTLPEALERQLGDASRLDVTPADPHMRTAATLVWKHRLRGADAVHLATALAVREELAPQSEFYFVSSDSSLNHAALAEGLEVINPAA